MSYQDRIYGQCGICPERNQTVKSFRTSSDLYIFNRPDFYVSGATKIDCTSGLTNGDTGVYILTDDTNISFDFIFSGDTSAFTDLNESKFKFGVYKYDNNLSGFTNNPQYMSEPIEWSTFSGTGITTQVIPVDGLDVDGDYMIKGHFINTYSTEFGRLLNKTYDTIETDDTSYVDDRDYYFVALNEADKPEITTGVNLVTPIDSLIVNSFYLVSGQTQVLLPETSSEYVISINGATLAETFDYDINIITSGSVQVTLIDLYVAIDDKDILTVVYVNSDTPSTIINKIFEVLSPIASGTTNNEGSNEVYYNITTSRYELFLDSTPTNNDDILLTINGAVLANNIDYYQSISNPKRIILNGDIFVGDIINIYYNSNTTVVGNIQTPAPTFSWNIQNTPTNENGLFTVEVSDTNIFRTIIFSATTPYIVGINDYNLQIPLQGQFGDEYYYRVKNEKNYQTLCGSIISTIKYSDTTPIVVGVNSINSY